MQMRRLLWDIHNLRYDLPVLRNSRGVSAVAGFHKDVVSQKLFIGCWGELAARMEGVVSQFLTHPEIENGAETGGRTCDFQTTQEYITASVTAHMNKTRPAPSR